MAKKEFEELGMPVLDILKEECEQIKASALELLDDEQAGKCSALIEEYSYVPYDYGIEGIADTGLPWIPLNRVAMIKNLGKVFEIEMTIYDASDIDEPSLKYINYIINCRYLPGAGRIFLGKKSGELNRFIGWMTVYKLAGGKEFAENSNEYIMNMSEDEETLEIRNKWHDIMELAVTEFNISKMSYAVWLQNLYVKRVYEGNVILSSDDNNVCTCMKHIETKYGPLIKTALNMVTGKEYEVFFDIGEDSDAAGQIKRRGDIESCNVLVGDGTLVDVGQTLSIDGSEDLSSVIMFGKGGCVFEIQLKRPDSCFFEGKEPYIIEVVGQGPSTSYTGGGKIKFWDASGSDYELKIIDEEKKRYFVLFFSENPQITKIEWTYFSQHVLE